MLHICRVPVQVFELTYLHRVDVGEVGGVVQLSLSAWVLKDHRAGRSWPRGGWRSVGLRLYDNRTRGKEHQHVTQSKAFNTFRDVTNAFSRLSSYN